MLRRVAFVLALIAQIALLAVWPLNAGKIERSGRVITLDAQIVARHDLLHGGFMDLRYAVASPPGLDKLDASPGDFVYTVGQTVDGVWNPIKVSKVFPADILPTQQMILGRVEQGEGQERMILYGFESIFLPDSVQRALKSRIGRDRKLEVDVAVDGEGKWSFIRIHAGDVHYEK